MITHVLWTLGRAGAERVVFDIATHLPKEVFDVRVIAAGGGGEMAEDFRSAGIPIAIGPETRDRRQTVRFLRAELKAHRPQILHTHLGGDVWAGYVAFRERIHPWIATLHNDDRDDGFAKHALRGMAYRRADHVACVSEAVRHYAKKEFRVKDDRLSVIRNGLDLGLIPLRGSLSFHDTPRLISVGRLVPQKDHETLLRALAQIKRPWVLDVYGEGHKRHELEKLAEELGILPRVQFHGNVPQVAKQFAKADIFCFPSRWEGQGLAMVEAAVSGVPIIASDLPVFRETFDEHALAFAAPGSVEDWTRQLRMVLADPISALRRAGEAQKIARKTFTLERMIKEYTDLYQRYAHSSRQ